MQKNNFIIVFSYAILCGLGILIFGCSTGVENSPNPGIVRVTLQSDPTDTTIAVIGDALTVSKNDVFEVSIFQSRVFHDSIFALLFENLNSFRQQDVIYNILTRENGEYVKFIIFESFVPPGDYDRLQFGLTASIMKIKNFEIPVRLPEGSTVLVDLSQDFEVFENDTTEINVQISPFKSLVRSRDSYNFVRKIKIVSVNYK